MKYYPKNNTIKMKRFYKALTLLFLIFFQYSQAQGDVTFFQTDWGNKLSWDKFCEKVKTSGFDGIDIWLPSNTTSQEELKTALSKHNLLLNLMHGTNKGLPFKESLKAYENKLIALMKWKPVLINSQTGSDFFTEEENMAFIKVATKISDQYNIPVYHETHRSRFSYSLPITNSYLSKNLNFEITLDISHWMVVHESLLEGKEKELALVMERSNHIHARVGHKEGPQVNDPEAPEWKSALNRHLDIWEAIIKKRWKKNNKTFTVTSEFGPPGYMPTAPHTNMPLGDQWKANVFIMNAIKKRLNIK